MTPALIVAATVVAMPGMLQFADRVHDYVETHRRVAAGIEQPLCSDPEELVKQADALAAAIREARPRAKEGDIFTLKVAAVFRARIATLVRRSNIDVAALVWQDEGEELEVQVFGTLPLNAGPAPWMPIVGELPELPVELEYRFVGRDLVLVDIGARMVVDVLRDALPLPVNARPSAAPRTCCDVHPELAACWM
jgi:hypothetical protein